MTHSSRWIQAVSWSILGLVVAWVGVSYWRSRDIENRRPMPLIGPVAAFQLTNQAGERKSLADLSGKVWVADIIFTRCAGPCPEMTAKMAELQSALAEEKGARLVSLTTDPDFDRPEVLAEYGRKFGADVARWWFLTGEKSEIRKLAVEGLKLTAVEKEAAEREGEKDLFIHSTIFVVVDGAGQLRRAFETSGEGVDWKATKSEIVETVKALLKG